MNGPNFSAAVRDLVDIVTAVSPQVRVVTRVFLGLTASVAAAVTIALVLDRQAIDRAETALWTVSGPPCQQIAPVSLEGLSGGRSDPAPLRFEMAQGAFDHGSVVCSEIDHERGRQTRPFAVCQFGSPLVVRLDTSRGQVFFKAPADQPMTISFAGDAPHCVLGANFPAALFNS